MSSATEVILEIDSKKAVDKSPDTPEDTELFKYKLIATNSEAFENIKFKCSKDIGMEGDTFSLREMVAQKGLEEVVSEDE